jgi:hypothetical protein
MRKTAQRFRPEALDYPGIKKAKNLAKRFTDMTTIRHF